MSIDFSYLIGKPSLNKKKKEEVSSVPVVTEDERNDSQANEESTGQRHHVYYSSSNKHPEDIGDFSLWVNGKYCRKIKGYPRFIFCYSGERRKYALVNEQTGEFTNYFIDEVIYSEYPPLNWTEDYIVVRIGDNYYLCDNEGNCFHQSRYEYTICRNVFVNVDEDFIVNRKLEKVEMTEEVRDSYFIAESSRYVYLMRKDPDDDDYGALFTSEGVERKEDGKIRYYHLNSYYKNLDDWVLGNQIIDKEFQNIVVSYMRTYKVLISSYGRCIRFWTSEDTVHYFSIILGKEVKKYCSDGGREVLWVNQKTYYFYAPDCYIVMEEQDDARFTRDLLVCRLNNKLSVYDSKPQKIAEEELSAKELYQQILLEKIADNNLVQKEDS